MLKREKLLVRPLADTVLIPAVSTTRCNTSATRPSRMCDQWEVPSRITQYGCVAVPRSKSLSVRESTLHSGALDCCLGVRRGVAGHDECV